MLIVEFDARRYTFRLLSKESLCADANAVLNLIPEAVAAPMSQTRCNHTPGRPATQNCELFGFTAMKEGDALALCWADLNL